MPKPSVRRIPAAATMPLSLPPVIDKQQAVEKLLDVLFEMALKGDLAAMKLYLDYHLKRGAGEPSGLTAEEALRILSDQR